MRFFALEERVIAAHASKRHLGLIKRGAAIKIKNKLTAPAAHY